MILAFKPQFVNPIQYGIKIHTFREDPHNRWKAGNSIQAATGVRTKNYNCFYESVCTGVQLIEINPRGKTYPPEIKIDGFTLWDSEVKKLIRNDGFMSITEFNEWFDKPWKGKIIHWTNHRY